MTRHGNGARPSSGRLLAGMAVVGSQLSPSIASFVFLVRYDQRQPRVRHGPRDLEPELQVIQATKAQSLVVRTRALDFSIISLSVLAGMISANSDPDALDAATAYVGEAFVRATTSGAWVIGPDDGGRPVVCWREPRPIVPRPRVLNTMIGPLSFVDEHLEGRDLGWMVDQAQRVVSYINRPYQETRAALGLEVESSRRQVRRRRLD